MSTTNETRYALIRARAKVREGWTQNKLAVDRYGYAALPHRPNACRWCASGALRAVNAPWLAYRVLREQTPRHLVATYNDEPGRTQADILDLFDRAIEKVTP